MPDNIDRYVPEFNESEMRERLASLDLQDLTDMLIRAYKEKRLLAKMCDDLEGRLDRIAQVAQEPSSLVGMPGVPTAEQLRRMMDEQ